ncbi:MAG: TonB-dependent receptor, partial [Bacteroidetes bacterium]|nr:TonB-dependent receptor [Bacteroidota bacterium]
TYRLSVTMIGYRRFVDTVYARTTGGRVLKVFLVPSPIQTEQVVITASKRRQLLTDVPVSVSLVSAASMERRNVISLDDALRYVPGVNFIQDQVNIRGSSGYARGIGSRVLLLIDGIPLLSGDTQEAVWESIPVSDIDHVEVMKGGGSALYGSSALGGVVDVITKNNVDVNSTGVKLYGGFYQQPTYTQWRWSSHERFFQGASITHSQPIGIGNFGVTASLSYKKDDGYIENNFFRRLNFFVKTAGNLSQNQSLKVFGDLFNQYSGNFLYWEDINHALQPASSSLGEWVNSTRADLAGIYTNVFSDKFLYIVRGSYYFNHWYDNFGDTPTGIGDSSTSSTGYLELQGTWNADPATILTFGAVGQLDFVNSNSFTNKQSNSGAIYFQGERKFYRLHATLGARYDYEKMEGKEAFNQVSPKLGFVYDLGKEASLRASIGSGFRAPSIGETYASIQSGGVSIVPNPALLPERSLSEEIGGRFPVWYFGLIDAAIFQSDYWNMIEPEFTNAGQITFQNVTRARIQGYEIDASSDVGTDFLTLKASYTYIYPLDLTTHGVLKYRSRELFYVSADFQKSIYCASIDFRYISKFENYDRQLVQYGIVKNGNDRVPAYVTDVRAGVDLTSIGFPLDVSFVVNNAFNYYYVEMIGNMAPLRNYSLVVSTKL